MLIEVKVPQLSESVAEATLSTWHIKEGDAVARDQNLIDIETDKVVLELPAPDAGVIVKIIKANGDLERVEVNRSSGQSLLDDAARRIVQMASPYAAFPDAIRRDTDVLEITRTWTFTNADRLRSD